MKLTKKLLRHPATNKLLGWLTVAYAKVVFGTSKVVVHGPKPPAQSLFVLWHQQLVMLPAILPKNKPATALMSASRDGRLVAYPASKYGIHTATGSSSQKALAGVREILRAAKKKHNLIITPDGPRGPAKKAKEGAVEIARLTGLPLIPVGARSTRGGYAGSWDALHIPYPFGTIHVVYGTPLTSLTGPALEIALSALEIEASAYANPVKKP